MLVREPLSIPPSPSPSPTHLSDSLLPDLKPANVLFQLKNIESASFKSENPRVLTQKNPEGTPISRLSSESILVPLPLDVNAPDAWDDIPRQTGRRWRLCVFSFRVISYRIIFPDPRN